MESKGEEASVFFMSNLAQVFVYSDNNIFRLNVTGSQWCKTGATFGFIFNPTLAQHILIMIYLFDLLTFVVY